MQAQRHVLQSGGQTAGRTRPPSSPPRRQLLPLLLCCVLVGPWVIIFLICLHGRCSNKEQHKLPSSKCNEAGGDGCGGAQTRGCCRASVLIAHPCQRACPAWGPAPPPHRRFAGRTPPPRPPRGATRCGWLRLCVGAPWRAGWPCRVSEVRGLEALALQGRRCKLVGAWIGCGSLSECMSAAGTLDQQAGLQSSGRPARA